MTTDNGSNFMKAFSVFAPSKDELEVSSSDVDTILSNETDSVELPAHQKVCCPFIKPCFHSRCRHCRTRQSCQALWDKTGRVVQAKMVNDEESPLQVIQTCASRWNSVSDAVQRLNRINKLPESQTLNKTCQRLDMSKT